MEQLNYPDKVTWQFRSDWINKEIEDAMGIGSHMVSDHAAALFLDVHACYCAGAFLAVIILSISIIDAHLRETEAGDSKIGTAKLLDEFYTGGDIGWLRKLRNKYVHLDLNSPALTMNYQYHERESMENEAKLAMKMIIHAFFQSPGT